MSEGRETERPLPPGNRPLEIWRVPKPPQKMFVRWLASMDGIYTHYVKKQVPCAGDGVCPRSWHSLPIVWRGYAPAEMRTGDHRLWIPVVVEITERLYWCLEGVPLRGTVWALWRRSGVGRRDECYGEIVDEVDPSRLRVDIDWIACVRRRYQNQPLLWGKLPELGKPESYAPSVETAVYGDTPPETTVNPEEEKRRMEAMRELGRRTFNGGAK